MWHLSVRGQPPCQSLKNIQKLFLDGFCMFLATCCKKIGKSGRPKVLNLLSRPMWKTCFRGATVGFEVLLFFFSQWKGRKETQPPKRGPCISASYVKKGSFIFLGQPGSQPSKRGPCISASYMKKVLAAVFIFLGQDVPGCAILVFPGNGVPGQPPVNPSKVSKRCFWWVLHVFGKMLQKLFFFSTLRWHKLDFFELIVSVLLFLSGQAC